MIYVGVHCYHVEFGIFFQYSKQTFEEDFLHVWFDDLSSVFCTPNQMILMLVAAMVETLNSHVVQAYQHNLSAGMPFIPALQKLQKIPVTLLTYGVSCKV